MRDPSNPFITEPKVYHCGSIKYTSRSLAMLFFWLLWGDFCYMLMEAVTPSIMPLKFQVLGASNTEIGLILGTIPAVIYSCLNPIISFKSDRYRSRFGRRIPFIVFSLPFLVLCLVGLGFGDKIGLWLHTIVGNIASEISPNSMVIWTLGGMMVVFMFFNTFVTSTFWYLFNDVVPAHLLARFMSWFRMISMVSIAIYNFCIFRFARSHFTEILVGAALLYLFGFGLMCLNIREGKYPPPPDYIDGESGPLAAVKTYAKECLSLKHYWFQWMNSFIGAIGGGVTTFSLLFTLAIGLDLKQIGYINGCNSLCVSVLVLGTGWLADRFHPIRIVMAGSIFGMLIAIPATLIWLFWRPSPAVAFWVALAISLGLTAPLQAMVAMADPPLLMRLFPRERYGQFCSTNAIWRSIGGVIGGGLVGGFLDVLGHWVGKERAYLFIPVWSLCFSLPTLICLVKLYKSWKRYGGDASYLPPMIGVDGKEMVPPDKCSIIL
ncbi:MAG: MFS transporter [Chthoniobacteraceae bacterium]